MRIGIATKYKLPPGSGHPTVAATLSQRKLYLKAVTSRSVKGPSALTLVEPEEQYCYNGRWVVHYGDIAGLRLGDQHYASLMKHWLLTVTPAHTASSWQCSIWSVVVGKSIVSTHQPETLTLDLAWNTRPKGRIRHTEQQRRYYKQSCTE